MFTEYELVEGLRIRAERERERQNEADQARITAQFCKVCGTRLDNGKCGYGCVQSVLSDAEMDAPIETQHDEHIMYGQA